MWTSGRRMREMKQYPKTLKKINKAIQEMKVFCENKNYKEQMVDYDSYSGYIL
jgi:hypothetical protein